ncbi:MAG: diguanylate cyclase [Thermodesulfobacteriota bacterium]
MAAQNSKPKKISLRTLWYGTVVLVTILPLLILLPWVGAKYYSIRLDSSLKLQVEEALESKTDIEHEINNITVLLESTGVFLSHALSHGADEKMVSDHIDSLFENSIAVHSITAFNKMGVMTIHKDQPKYDKGDHHEGDEAEQLATDISKKPVFLTPMHGRRFYGAPYLHDGRTIFDISVPIGRGKTPAGVLIASVDTEALWKSIEEHLKRRSATIYLADKTGRLISATRKVKPKAGDPLTNLDIVSTSISGAEWNTKTVYTGLKGERVFGAYIPLKVMNWVFIAEIPESRITEPIKSSLFFFAALSVLMFILSAVLGLALSAKILKPISELSSAFSGISEGNYSTEVSESSVKELDTLSSGFNTLASEIQERDIARKDRTELLNALGLAQSLYITDMSANTVFDKLLGKILSITGSEYGFIGRVLHSKDGEPYLKNFATTNIAWNDETRKFYEENAPEGLEFHNMQTLFGLVITSGEPVISNDPANDKRGSGIPEGHPPLNAFLGIPFFRGDELIGMVGLANRAGGYNQDVIQLLKPFVFTCENIIDAFNKSLKQKTAEDALRDSQRLLESVIDNSTAVIYVKDLEGRYILINRWFEKLFNIKKENVKGQIDEDIFPAELANSFRMNDLEVIRKKKPVRFEETAPHDDGPHTYISVKFPLYDSGDDVYAVCGISTDITERKVMEDELLVLSTTDILTGAYNRKKMDEILIMEMERARRFKHPLSLLLFDIDDFKPVNDTYGHAAGDEALRAIADIVRGHMRKTNYFIRWGGEEFLIVAVETALEGGANLADRIRLEIAAYKFEKITESVTVSFGVTEFKEDDTSDSLLKRADDALYEAKDGGRNCVVTKE